MANSRAIAEDELQRVTAIAIARRKRQSAGKKQIQKGGVLTAAKARAAVDARVEAEAIKAGRKVALQYKRDQQQAANDARVAQNAAKG